MDAADIEAAIETGIEDCEATVSRPRSVDENYEDSHFAATIISPAFEGETLVDQHQRVYDALGEHMTTDIHAIELTTYTPDEYEAHGE
ncbi:MAG: transcriptional regulator, BolA family protein [Halonotius sp. J07HN4]|jgi:transcriptional regulator, BolA protein family|nr:MAG: transcriptional regulator, BolA family protein [Halonotius sp. J07HN4]